MAKLWAYGEPALLRDFNMRMGVVIARDDDREGYWKVRLNLDPVHSSVLGPQLGGPVTIISVHATTMMKYPDKSVLTMLRSKSGDNSLTWFSFELQRSLSINELDHEGSPLIDRICACPQSANPNERSTFILQMLLQQGGADPNALSADGHSPLQSACINSASMTMLLLSAKADPNHAIPWTIEGFPGITSEDGTPAPGTYNEYSAPPLVRAVTLPTSPCTRTITHMLLEAKADPNKRRGDSNAVPLTYVGGRGDLDMVELLLKHGADPNMVVEIRSSVDKPTSRFEFISRDSPISSYFLGERDPLSCQACLVAMLASQRVRRETIHMAISRAIRLKDYADKPPSDEMMACILPILEAEMEGRRRWCDYCRKVCLTRDMPRCFGCRRVAYCDRKCQRAAWKDHKLVCKELAQLAAKSASEKAADDCDANKEKQSLSARQIHSDGTANTMLKDALKESTAAEVCAEAEAELETTSDAKARAALHARIARALMCSGNVSAALESATTAIEEDATNANARAVLTRIYTIRGNAKRAAKYAAAKNEKVDGSEVVGEDV